MVALRALLMSLLLCLGCLAQANPPADLAAKIERQMRAQFVIQPERKVTVGPLRPSDFPGYQSLTVTFGANDNKQEFEFLLADDRKTMMRVFHVDLDKDPFLDVMKQIDVSGRPTRGAKDAKVVAVVYDDFECPFCARMHGMLFPTLFKEYGDRIQFIYKDFPLEDVHPWAVHAAVDAGCLAAQSADAYWDFADYVHANQKEISGPKGSVGQNATLDRLTTAQGKKHNLDATALQACVKAQDEKAVRASQKEGEKMGVSATPEMFVNGRKVDGALPIENLRAAFDRALQDAGLTPVEHKSTSADTK
jgi:protein-disulfide isomerase